MLPRYGIAGNIQKDVRGGECRSPMEVYKYLKTLPIAGIVTLLLCRSFARPYAESRGQRHSQEYALSIQGSMPDAKPDPILGRRAEQVILLLSLALAAGLLVLVGVRWYAYHWDFHMFYGSAREFAAGVSPYRGQGLSYFHPPLMLYVYRPFTMLSEKWAVELWYVLKLVALAGLFTVWHRDFVRLQWRGTTILFFIFAYGATIYSDLVAGNLSIFEQLLLWIGFSQLLRGRILMFALCVIVAAQVKITPILFAGLLIVACEPRRWGAFVATVIGFLAVFSLNFLLEPDLFRDFLAALGKLDERGVDCPSFLALVRDVSDLALGKESTQRSLLDEVVFLGIAGAVGVSSLIAWLTYRKRALRIDQRLLICFACVVFVLISPRFKIYSYIVVLVPTLYLFRNAIWSRYVPLAIAVVAVPVFYPLGTSLLPFRIAFEFFNSYLLLFATLAVWIVYLDVLRAPGVALRPSS
jgi:Glycosyltransferase family 87